MESAVWKAWEECDKTDTLFVLFCTTVCWTIIPAVGIAYSGYSWRRNGVSTAMLALISVAVCSIQWWIVGYTLAYGDGGLVFGNLKHLFHQGVLSEPVGTIPAVLFSEFQLVFEATVCAIAVGGFCERGRLLPVIPFVFLWATFVYCPLAHMVWGGGLGDKYGVLDFAGGKKSGTLIKANKAFADNAEGTPVHVCSGATATAISLYLSYPIFRSRKSETRTPTHIRLHRPGNAFYQLISLIIIWGSWLAFDAGTTLALNFQSVMALCVTNLCASAGAMTWTFVHYYETGKWCLDATYMGAISGLVMITPAAGFVDLTTSFFLGIIGAVVCRQALRIKFTKWAHQWRWVDNGDTFATHCVGGVVATICTGLFARREVAAYGGIDIDGGVIFDGNVKQLGIQILEALIGFVWAFTVSFGLIALIDCIPSLEVLATDKHIIAGLDHNETEESFCDPYHPDEEDYAPTDKGILQLTA